jgi:hypothetical protein
MNDDEKKNQSKTKKSGFLFSVLKIRSGKWYDII